MHLAELHVLPEPVDALVQGLVERVVKEKIVFVVPIVDVASFPLLQDPYLGGKGLQLLRHLSVGTDNVLQVWVFLQDRKRADLSTPQQVR